MSLRSCMAVARGFACLASVIALANCGGSSDGSNPGNTDDDAGHSGKADGSVDGSHTFGADAGGGNSDSGKGKDSGHHNDSGNGNDSGNTSDSGGNDSGPPPDDCTNPGSDDPGAYPQLGFDSQPSYIPSDTLILTIDDVPDSTQTAKVLDILKNHNQTKATFFVNTQNWGGDLNLVQRMLDEGHEVGNHTVHHYHLAPGGGQDGIRHLSTAADIEAEITGVPTDFLQATGHTLPKLTIFRAPFGEPYQSGSPSDIALVSPVVARHAVEIGWNFDTQDTTTTDGNVVFNTFKGLVQTPGASGASWGIFLIHGVHPQDVDALPQILDYIDQTGFKLARVEDALCWKFGKHSKDLVP